MNEVVRFRHAVSLLGRFPALAGVDLDVEPGEVVLVCGPNGAGKTTLLRACAGLVAVTSGEASVLGHDLTIDRRSVRSRVALLGHQGFLYDDLTVGENLRFFTRAARTARGAIEAAMARLGLDGRLRDLPAAKLSTGQRRRVALAVLVARSPELWLLDEPHAGLDSAGRDLVDDLVREAVSRGTTVLLASHELERARGLATRSVTISGGRVVSDRPPGSQAGSGSDASGTAAAGSGSDASGTATAGSGSAAGAAVPGSSDTSDWEAPVPEVPVSEPARA